MTTNPSAPSVEKLKAWAKENRELALVVVQAMAFAQVERERVDAYIEPIFLKYGFTNDFDSPRNTHKGEPLTKSKDLYLSADEERCKEYYAECDRAHREHGYRGEEGTCPALVAEDIQVQAENVLLKSLEAFLGVGGFYTLDARKRALDLALNACVGGVK